MVNEFARCWQEDRGVNGLTSATGLGPSAECLERLLLRRAQELQSTEYRKEKYIWKHSILGDSLNERTCYGVVRLYTHGCGTPDMWACTPNLKTAPCQHSIHERDNVVNDMTKRISKFQIYALSQAVVINVKVMLTVVIKI